MRPTAIAMAAALLFAAPADAATRPAFHPFATSLVPLVSDGAAAAAWMPSAQTVGVLRAGGGTRTLAVPAGCAANPNEVSGLRAVGGGYLLYYCPASFGVAPVGPNGYVVQSIATGASASVPGVLPAGDGGSPPGFAAIGAQWLGGTIENHEGEGFPFDLRWRTGVAFAWPAHRLSIRQVEDLDLPRPARSLCAPLRRSTIPSPLGGTTKPATFFPYVYEKPWGAGVVRSGRLTLQRCGSPRRITLAATGAGQLQGGGGLITWVSGGGAVLHAYSPALRRAVTSSPTGPSLVGRHLGGVLFRSTIATRVGPGNFTPVTWAVSAAQALPGG